MTGMPPRVAFLLPLLLTLFLGAGCAHYQAGDGSPGRAFRTIYIAPVVNAAAMPQAVATFSRELRTEFARDARVTLADSPIAADVILQVELLTYDRTFTAVRPGDTALARKFDLNLVAKCSLQESGSGQFIFADREIRTTRQIFVDDGQNPAEYQAQPQLAAKLADQVLHTVLDVW